MDPFSGRKEELVLRLLEHAGGQDEDEDEAEADEEVSPATSGLRVFILWPQCSRVLIIDCRQALLKRPSDVFIAFNF